jgi:hypothetical protein
MAAWSLLQFGNLSFLNANDRIAIQTESRATVNAVKKYVGTATAVTVRSTVPTTLPTNLGYAYFDSATHRFVLHTVDGQTFYYLNIVNMNRRSPVPSVTVQFVPGGKTINMTLTTGAFTIATDIFVQNMVSGSVLPVPTNIASGVYLEFS